MNNYRTPSIPDQTDSRFVPFQKIANFRDLGGIPAADGKVIRPGVLFRSGHLAHSTQSDIRKLSSLGIQTIIDFRSEQETEREPDQLPPKPEIDVHHFRIQENGLPPFGKEIRNRIQNRTLNELDPSQIMTKMYRKLATEFTSAYEKFFNVLKSSNGTPVLWHCSAGKDRAGFASALIQKVLGVSDSLIMADYLLSTGRIAPRRRQLLMVTLMRGRKAGQFLRRMNEVDSRWLTAAFQAVEDEWGEFDSYTAHGLNLNQSDIQKIQEQYLTKNR